MKYKRNDFSQKKSCNAQVTEDALKALREIQLEAERNGTSEMTLEEINLEIFLSRREREAREARMRLVGNFRRGGLTFA